MGKQLDLSIFPWEDPEVYLAEIEAYLAETDAKPWLDEYDEADPEMVTPDWDGIVNDPAYDLYLTEVVATRYWSGAPACNWSFLDSASSSTDDDASQPAYASGMADEPGYDESTQPYLF